jgi:glycosyltransferase involved in cell wall biosynthesis
VKIALLPSWYPPHGGDFFADQARELALRGLEVSVLVPRIEPFKKPQRWLKAFVSGVSCENRNGVAEFRWCVPKISGSVHEMPRRTLYAAEKLFQALCRRQGKPDLIHAHSAMWAGYAAARIGQKYRIPYVLTEHRSRFNIPGEDVAPWMAPYFSLAFQNAEKVLLVGSLLRNGIKPYWPGAESAEVLSNGVHTERFTMSAPAADGKFHFLYVGTLNHRKGIDLLIEALQDLARKSDKALVHIIGDGPLSASIRQTLQTTGLENLARLYGHLPHHRVAEIMATMHAFVLPTRYDAQGVVFLEAMSCGLPIIATEGAPPEVCPEFAGIRIPVGSAGALTAAMLDMMLKYSSFDREKIRQHAIAQYDFNVVISRLASIYQATVPMK